jgi:hypothetical protein
MDVAVGVLAAQVAGEQPVAAELLRGALGVAPVLQHRVRVVAVDRELADLVDDGARRAAASADGSRLGEAPKPVPRS